MVITRNINFFKLKLMETLKLITVIFTTLTLIVYIVILLRVVNSKSIKTLTTVAVMMAIISFLACVFTENYLAAFTWLITTILTTIFKNSEL